MKKNFIAVLAMLLFTTCSFASMYIGVKVKINTAGGSYEEQMTSPVINTLVHRTESHFNFYFQPNFGFITAGNFEINPSVAFARFSLKETAQTNGSNVTYERTRKQNSFIVGIGTYYHFKKSRPISFSSGLDLGYRHFFDPKFTATSTTFSYQIPSKYSRAILSFDFPVNLDFYLDRHIVLRLSTNVLGIGIEKYNYEYTTGPITLQSITKGTTYTIDFIGKDLPSLSINFLF